MSPKKEPTSVGIYWNLEMARVREHAEEMRKHLRHSKPDLVIGFDYALSMIDAAFWKAKEKYDRQETVTR